MNWNAAHREAMVAAAEAREELDLNSLDRIDVFEVIVRAGLKVMFRPLQRVAAFYIPPREPAAAGVLINSQHPLALQRYSGAHEYGHHVFGHGHQIDRDGDRRLKRANATRDERLAEAFAAWFLMPPETARAALGRLGIDRPAAARDAYALALRLGVSYDAVCTHLPSLKLATTAAAYGWADRPLKMTKQEIILDPPLGGWRNDVWVLTEADAEVPLVVRCGDRILFDSPVRPPASVPEGLTVHELEPQDLLSQPRMCVDVALDALPGPRSLTIACSQDGHPTVFTLCLERPLRGRYFSRALAAR